MIHNPPVAKWGISQSHAALPVIQVSRAMNDSLVTEVDIDIESQLIEKQESQNIVGMVRGTGSGDSLIVVSAHYDHIGQLGNAVFPGANDNASGVALLLALARHFAQHKPRYDMVFIAFSGEEVGLVGSQYFVNHPTFDLQRISFMLNFDMVGTGINGIKVVNGSNMKRDFAVLKNLNDSLGLVKAVVPRVGGCISDHCHFCKMGVPSFYIHTLGGPVHYHDVHDRPEALPLEEFDNLTKLMIAYLGVLSR
jgi:Zn-dependent M28 family amino/carboxypeptidase